MRLHFLAAAALLFAGTANAQTSPNFTGAANGNFSPLSHTSLNNAFISKQDVNGNTSGQHVTATGGNTARTEAAMAADIINVMSFSNGASVGTGSDDVTYIQAAINYAATIPGSEVYLPPPPSGYYNVCAADIELPGSTVAIRITGAAAGGSKIRILPTCASPPAQVIHQPVTTDQGDQTRVTLENLTIDGWCKATYDLKSDFAVGFTAHHVVFRNVATAGANIRIMSGGFEYDIGATNTAENVNDTGHTCYTNTTLPNYNLWTSGTDSSFSGLVAVNAQIANFYQDSGGGNRYIGSHAYNYINYPTTGVDFRSQYGFELVGAAMIVGSYAEDFLNAGIYVSNAGGVGHINVIGNKFEFTGNPANTVNAIEIASGTSYINVIGNNAWQLKYIGYPQNIVKQDGTADPTSVVKDNAAATYSTASSLTSPGTATQEYWLNLKNPSTASYALTGTNWTANNSTGAITYQDAGTTTGGYFGFQPENGSGAAPVLHVMDGADGYDVMGGNIGSEALRAILTASAVNRVDVNGATTTNDPQIRFNGSDANVSGIISTKGSGSIFMEPNGLEQVGISPTGVYVGGQVQNAGALNVLSRAAATASHDNVKLNPAMSAPAWTTGWTYADGSVVKANSNYYEEVYGQNCVSASTGSGPTGTGTFIVDGTCMWNYVPTAVTTNSVTPTITAGTGWATSTGYYASFIGVTFSGSGSSAMASWYTETAGSCTSASSGTGPSGTGTGITDGTCTWNFLASAPAASQNNAGPHSFLWNNGGGAASYTVKFYGGLPVSNGTTGYEQTQALTIGGVRGPQNYSRMEFVTNSKKFVVRSYENFTTINWRMIVCNIDYTGCQYVSPTPYAMYAGGYAYTVIDFSAASGNQPRDIILENDEGGQFGGIDVLATEDVYLPTGGGKLLTMAVTGDSYPAGSGVPIGYSDFAAQTADRLGIRNVINAAAAGCGYIVSCSAGTAISRISDVDATNPYGASNCPDILLDANGTNDVAGSTAAAIATAQTTFVTAFRTACGANVPIILMGLWAHNNGGTSYTAGVTAENAMATAAAAMNDPNLFFVRVLTDPQGSWQTGTGFVGASVGTATFATNVMTVTAMTSGVWQVGMTVTAAGVAGGTTITSLGTGTGQTGTYNLSTSPGTIGSEAATGAGANGSGNTDWSLEGTNLHPNITGNRVFANRLVAGIRAALNASGY